MASWQFYVIENNEDEQDAREINHERYGKGHNPASWGKRASEQYWDESGGDLEVDVDYLAIIIDPEGKEHRVHFSYEATISYYCRPA